MKQFACLFFALIFSINSALTAQSKYTVRVEWQESIQMLDDAVFIKSLNFKGAIYNLNEHHYPIYRKKIQLPENTDEIHVDVEVLKTSQLDEAVEVPDENFQTLSWQIVTERKIPYLVLQYVPLLNGELVSEFAYKIDASYKDFDFSSKRLASENSVLNEGDWYKLKVSEDGLYKVDKSFLEDLGLNPSEINPKNIQIYGNGGGMLPEPNHLFRHDDLVENSIYVKGESDESFDNGDFILFYGASAHRWNWNASNEAFEHELNIYDDNNYYFLHIGETPGKRVQEQSNSLLENFTLNFYTDHKFYEWENQNLVHTGRQWFGEYFSYNDQYNINFNFSNRLLDEPVRIKARGVARSSSTSNLLFKHNGAEILEVPIPALPSSSENHVTEGAADAQVISSDNVIDLSVSYDKNGNSSAFAYLDYVELQAKCGLTYNGGTLLIREPQSVGENRITKFEFTSNLDDFVVWDVTNQTNAIALELSPAHSFISATDSLKTFAIHDYNSSSYKKPVFEEKIENQNLHAQAVCDFVIVTAPEFLEAAERLAEFHRQTDGLTVNIATTNQIYNEFSSGRKDLVAVRDYLRMLYHKASNEEDIIDDVLLFGDASFDYKGIGALNDRYSDQNFVPTYESYSSFKIGPSYCTDDFLAVLDDNEGAGDVNSFDGLDIGMGRIVCQTPSEAEAVVDKIVNYKSVNSLGDWRSNICFVADDVDEDWEYRLQENVDEIADVVDVNYPNYNVNKIYTDAYQQVSSAGGQRYPEAREAIVNSVNEGTLIVHYYGHGGEVGWAEERILELIDINTWENINNLPVFITATCEFSRYDDSKRVSAGEQALLNPEGAGIALFTTTRTITESDAKSLSRAFYDYAIPERAGEVLSFGQIMRSLKNDLPNYNKKKFTLLGDPALKLPIPTLNIVVQEVLDIETNASIDTIQALSRVRVKGAVVSQEGEVQDGFNGIVKPKIYDKPSQLQTLNNDMEELEPFNFELQQNILYAGKVTVENGLFEFDFVVPKDIAYNEDFGKMSFYAYSDSIDALGSYAEIVIGGFDENALEDTHGPTVDLFMNNTDFRFGGITNSSPSLYAIVEDESGINTTGNGIGHNLVATLDENSQESIVLNHYYEADLDSYQKGVVSYPYTDLEDGIHQLKIKVWDVYNNSSEAYTEFLVVSDEGLVLENLMNYPNPFNDFTRIHFEHNRPNEALEVRMDIYDLGGKLVKTELKTITENAYANADFIWRGDSNQGTSISSGMYLCKISVKAMESSEETTISSQMVLIK